MATFWQDLKLGTRRAVRAPGFSIMAVSTLALGIGVNTAVFSVVNTVLLRPLPVKDPARLRSIDHQHIQRGFINGPSLYADLLDFRRQLPSFELLSGSVPQTMNLAGAGDPERALVASAEHEFFTLLGVQPALGRVFRPDEDQPGGPHVAVLTHELWARRFGSDPRLESLRLTLEGEPYAVIGVLPEGFRFVGRKMDLYIPLAGRATRVPVDGVRPKALQVYGRLRPDASDARVQAELAAATAALNAAVPPHRGWRLVAGEVREFIVPDVRASLWMLLGAVGLVLLIACVNVANLLILRAAEQRRDLAVRMAMGAGSFRLVRQFVAESIPLAAAGAGIGLAFAWGCTRLASAIPADRIPRLAETRLDATVLAFTAGISLLTVFLAAFFPALSISRTDPESALREAGRNPGAGRGTNRLRNLLVAGECALALLLSIGAILTARTFTNLSSTPAGFNTRNVLVADIDLPRAKYNEPAKILDFQRRWMEILLSQPGVVSASFTDSLPLGGRYMKGDFRVEGENYASPADIPVLFHRTIDSGYFHTFDIRLLSGRGFTDADHETAEPVLLLNKTAAQRLFGDRNPVGARVQAEGKLRTVVGIVADSKHMDVSMGNESEVILAMPQHSSPSFSVAVRFDPSVVRDPAGFAPALRQSIQPIDPNQSLSHVLRFDRIVADRLSPRWLNQVLLGSFAVLALLLAGIGLYGVLSYTVERRSREFGVRLALGARQADVIRLVVRQGLVLACAGVAAGTVAAASLTRTIQSILFGVSPTEPAVFAAAAVILLAVAAAACYWPARRATRVDPANALRVE